MVTSKTTGGWLEINGTALPNQVDNFTVSVGKPLSPQTIYFKVTTTGGVTGCYPSVYSVTPSSCPQQFYFTENPSSNFVETTLEFQKASGVHSLDLST